MATYRLLQRILKHTREINSYLASNIILHPLNSKRDVLEMMALECANYYGLEFNEFVQMVWLNLPTRASQQNNASLSYRELQQALKTGRANGFVCRYPLNTSKAKLLEMYNDYQAVSNQPQRTEIYQYDGDSYTIQYGTGVSYTQRRVGVEIEFCTSYTRAEVIDLVLENTGIQLRTGRNGGLNSWRIKSDGSISNGWEIVSPPMVDFAELKLIMDCLSNDPECFVDRSCGLHVHLEAKDMTREQMVKYIQCWQKLELEFDKLVSSSRRANNNNYCYSVKDYIIRDDSTLSSICSRLGNRYHKLNPFSFLKYGTFEVRHLEGTLNYDKLETWIRLQKRVLEYSLNHTVDETVNHINQILQTNYAQV